MKKNKQTKQDAEEEEGTMIRADKVEDALDRVGGIYDEEGGAQKEVRKKEMVHIQFQQRTTRKCLTLIQGLPDDLDFKKIVRHMKKIWNCNGTVINNEEWGQVIQLQGDSRNRVIAFLIEEGLSTKDLIKKHGF